MRETITFASDNNASVHPRIMEAISNANRGHAISYGDDTFTCSAIKKFKEEFGEHIEVYFVYNGTGANVLGLTAATDSFNSIICAETAHINVDECGAPEKFSGCKLVPLPSGDGKIRVNQLTKYLNLIGIEHHSQPKVISITQATEFVTVYSLDEIREITGFAHQNGMLVHMDGARIANAAASLNVSLGEMTAGTGIDILSFGGTKNGMMYGEAVVFLDRSLSPNFRFIRKQGMQLASKMRYIAAQFEALLTDNLWLKNAKWANRMAQMLAEQVNGIPGIYITQRVDANAVFAVIPRDLIPRLQERYYFYVWNKEKSEVRWMTSFDTTEQDVVNFVKEIRELSGQ